MGEMDDYEKEKQELENFIKRAGFEDGWYELEARPRRMAEQAVEEIATLKAEIEQEKETSEKLYIQKMRFMKENSELKAEIERNDEIITRVIQDITHSLRHLRATNNREALQMTNILSDLRKATLQSKEQSRSSDTEKKKQAFEPFWDGHGELLASMCKGNIKQFAKDVWNSALSVKDVEELEETTNREKQIYTQKDIDSRDKEIAAFKTNIEHKNEALRKIIYFLDPLLKEDKRDIESAIKMAEQALGEEEEDAGD